MSASTTVAGVFSTLDVFEEDVVIGKCIRQPILGYWTEKHEVLFERIARISGLVRHGLPKIPRESVPGRPAFDAAG